MSRKIRTAVVGLNMGLEHAYAYHRSERAELVCVADLDEAKAMAVAQKLGCGYTTDWASVLDDVDAVSVCTPHFLHAGQSLQAIEAGKHVLLEKPLAITEADCLKVIEAAERQKTTFMVAYIVRYLPTVQKLKQILESGQFGQPFNVNCWVEAYLPPMPGSWFSKKDKLGGGVLFSHGCHYIDLLLWLFGHPRQVMALGTRGGTDWMEGEGTSHSLMEFESGAIGHLVCSWGMKYADSPACLHIHTPEALLILDKNLSAIEAVTENGRTTIFETPEADLSGPGGAARWEVEHFLDCIETGSIPLTNGRDALKSYRAISAMYASAGVPVKAEVLS